MQFPPALPEQGNRNIHGGIGTVEGERFRHDGFEFSQHGFRCFRFNGQPRHAGFCDIPDACFIAPFTADARE